MSTCIKSLIKNVNLIIGCDIGCPYCYARNNCRRFHMKEDMDLDGIDWVVVGTETGKRKGKSESKPEWVDNIMRQTAARGIPTFMKEDLVPILGENRMIQQMPPAFLL